jgi:hypothetical protein
MTAADMKPETGSSLKEAFKPLVHDNRMKPKRYHVRTWIQQRCPLRRCIRVHRTMLARARALCSFPAQCSNLRCCCAGHFNRSVQICAWARRLGARAFSSAKIRWQHQHQQHQRQQVNVPGFWVYIRDSYFAGAEVSRLCVFYDQRFLIVF